MLVAEAWDIWLTQTYSSVASAELNSLFYAVLALGSSDYETYCAFGMRLDIGLAALGASRLVPCGKLDRQSTNMEAVFERWLAVVVKRLSVNPFDENAPMEPEEDTPLVCC